MGKQICPVERLGMDENFIDVTKLGMGIKLQKESFNSKINYQYADCNMLMYVA